jgi:hypothetical protein
VLPVLLYISLVLFAIRCVLEAHENIYKFSNSNTVFARTSRIIFYFSFLTGISCLVSWCYLSWKSINSTRNGIPHDAYQALVFLSTFIMTSILGLFVNTYFKATTWPNANEACLVSYVYMQLVSSVLITGFNMTIE